MFFSALAARVCGSEGSGFYIFVSSYLFSLSWCDDQLEILLPYLASLRGADACHFFAGGGGAAFELLDVGTASGDDDIGRFFIGGWGFQGPVDYG